MFLITYIVFLISQSFIIQLANGLGLALVTHINLPSSWLTLSIAENLIKILK